MIKSITMFETPNGEVFRTEQQALRRYDDIVCQKLESFIEHAFPDVGHQPSIVKAVTRLADDKTITTNLLKDLLYTLEYG